MSTGASPWLGLTQDKHSAFLEAFPSVAINLRGTQLALEQSRHPSDTPNSPQGPEGLQLGWEGRHRGLLWDLVAISSPAFPQVHQAPPGAERPSLGNPALNRGFL